MKVANSVLTALLRPNLLQENVTTINKKAAQSRVILKKFLITATDYYSANITKILVARNSVGIEKIRIVRKMLMFFCYL